MIKYVYSEYSDRKGIGEEKIFDTFDEVIAHGNHAFNDLVYEDKQKLANEYKKKGTASARAFAIEITEEEHELWKEGELETQLEELWTTDVYDWIKKYVEACEE